MRRLTSSDLKELGLLKHYRIIRKWACKTNNLKMQTRATDLSRCYRYVY